MPLKLMYITNRPEIALIAEKNGVDRIFVDMEYIGKAERQGNLDTVQNHHTIHDVSVLRRVLTQSELLVRVNPIHDKTSDYSSSEEEIEAAIQAGADIVMLPFFKTVAEVKSFLRIVNGRVKTMLLLETPEAVDALNEILAIPGIDEIHIGINDLSIGYGKRFMFELLTDGTVERYLRCKCLQRWLWRHRLPRPGSCSGRDDHQGALLARISNGHFVPFLLQCRPLCRYGRSRGDFLPRCSGNSRAGDGVRPSRAFLHR